MEDSNTIEPPSGAFGIPKWMMKKGMRYEVDDFIVSPPSNEDGGFLHLRYGRNPRPRLRQPSPDCTNQEMAMTVEVRDGSTVITTVCSSERFDNTSPEAALIISPSGLSTKTASLSTSKIATENYVHPLLVFNFGDSESAVPAGESLNTTESPETLLNLAQEGFALNNSTSVEGNSNEIDLITGPSPSEKCYLASKTEDRKLGLFEKVNFIPITSKQEGALPNLLATTPISSPLPSPQTSPKSRRSVMGVVMDSSNKSSVHSYFCTKPFKGHQEGSNTKPGISEDAREISLSSSSLRTQQLEDATKTSQSLDSNSKLIANKRRQRPKPSSLREMNFWAPTSM